MLFFEIETCVIMKPSVPSSFLSPSHEQILLLFTPEMLMGYIHFTHYFT